MKLTATNLDRFKLFKFSQNFSLKYFIPKLSKNFLALHKSPQKVSLLLPFSPTFRLQDELCRIDKLKVEFLWQREEEEGDG